MYTKAGRGIDDGGLAVGPLTKVRDTLHWSTPLGEVKALVHHQESHPARQEGRLLKSKAADRKACPRLFRPTEFAPDLEAGQRSHRCRVRYSPLPDKSTLPLHFRKPTGDPDASLLFQNLATPIETQNTDWRILWAHKSLQTRPWSRGDSKRR